MRLVAGMISCRQREQVRMDTLHSFSRSDWGEAVRIVLDESDHADVCRRIEETFLRLLRTVAEGDADFGLLLEDDIDFNLRIRHNLERWPPLVATRSGDRPFLGSLYHCCQPILWRDARRRLMVAVPEAFWGGQALVISRATARHALANWTVGKTQHDALLPLLAAQIAPIYYHVPSLVQHRPVPSTWGNAIHCASDYDPLFVAR